MNLQNFIIMFTAELFDKGKYHFLWPSHEPIAAFNRFEENKNSLTVFKYNFSK
jgi:hypothetical protein